MAEVAEEKKETADTKSRVHTYPLIRVSFYLIVYILGYFDLLSMIK